MTEGKVEKIPNHLSKEYQRDRFIIDYKTSVSVGEASDAHDVSDTLFWIQWTPQAFKLVAGVDGFFWCGSEEGVRYKAFVSAVVNGNSLIHSYVVPKKSFICRTKKYVAHQRSALMEKKAPSQRFAAIYFAFLFVIPVVNVHMRLLVPFLMIRVLRKDVQNSLTLMNFRINSASQKLQPKLRRKCAKGLSRLRDN